MNFIILAKEVPDITFINPLSWDHEKGVLKRGKLPSRINPLDIKALAFAKDISSYYPGKSVIAALSMGPEKCINSLYRLSAMGCDRAVLVSDNRLGGADTYATSYILSHSILKIINNFFSGNSEFMIVSGMHSSDGDTAQVPPQLAQALGIPVISNVSGITQNNTPELLSYEQDFCRITPLVKFPCLVTVSDYSAVVYPSFKKMRMAELNKTVEKWDIEILGLKNNITSRLLSRTSVKKIYQKQNDIPRKKIEISSTEELKSIIEKSFLEIKESVQPIEIRKQTEIKSDRYPVCVFAEAENNSLTSLTRQIVSEAGRIADKLESSLTAVICSNRNENILNQLINLGCDRVLNIYPEPDCLYSDILISDAVSKIAEKRNPSVFLFPASPEGRIVASRTAYSLKAGLTADCTALKIVNDNENKKIMVQTRPALGGNITADIVTVNSFLQMATVRAGVFSEFMPLSGREGIIEHIEIKNNFPGIHVRKDYSALLNYLPEKNDIIVSIGAGIKSRKDVEKIIKPFAFSLKLFSGTLPPIAGSRKAVEKGYVERNFQVGQTGKSVSPVIYISIGISGAVQHIAGIKNAGTVISINTDRSAPVFENSDYFIIADYSKIVPEITQLFMKDPDAVYA